MHDGDLLKPSPPGRDNASTAILVLCAPRSGSSLAAGLLARLGVQMGADLLPADRWNPLGYFEDRAFLGLHRVMAFPGGDEQRIRLNLPADLPRPVAAHLERWRRAARHREARHPLWGIKDPRLVFLHDRVRPLLEAEVRTVVVRRDPEASRRSLAAMFGLKDTDAREIIDQYRRKLDVVGDRLEGPVHRFRYEDAIADPVGVVGRLAGFLGVEPGPDAFALVEPRLCRQAGGPG